jgi:beta-phosphoglucomutase-like phosphatase (HAD superfamily)
MTTPLRAEDWRPPPGTTALLFDCDGTLADTMPVHYVAWTAMLREHGVAFPEDRFYALGGMPTDGIIQLLAREQGITLRDIPAMSRDKERRYLEMMSAIRPVAPVLSIARRMHGAMPLGVGSGGERWLVEKTLTIIGARHLFDAIVGSDDTERHKPEPDVYLEAARRLGVEAARCVVFEDTDLGLESARRARMTGVDIRTFLRAP